MLIAVCSERSSCPCLCSGVDWKADITFGRLMKFSRYGLRLQAQRSNESPSGAFKQRDSLAQQDSKMEGPCPLPLRSKRIFNKCFRIVKTQKTSRGCSAHVMGSPFAPNEVPAPVCAAALSGSPTESVRSWHSITFRRLMKDSRYSMKKAGRSADTTTCFFQSQE